MQLALTKKPKNPIVIEGFPGFGLIGSITTEFLLEHLQTEHIGHMYFEDMPATVAIHKNKVIDPISVNYSKKYNLIIIHAITNPTGIEWKAADVVLDVCKQLDATHLITLEGVGSAMPQKKADMLQAVEGASAPSVKNDVFYYTNDAAMRKKLDKAKIKPLDEGIIVGVTSSLLLKSKIPTTALFAETTMGLPDSKAAARVIKALDAILGLKIDPEPLIKQANQFEKKLKALLDQAKSMTQQVDKKQVGYIG